VSVDLGTGDGRCVLHAARADPRRLVIGIDANAASMRRSSRRAADRSGGVPNAVFIVSSVESLPRDLAGVADRVTVSFPWGSLLQGLVTGDPGILDKMSDLCAVGAEVTVIWSITARDVAAIGTVSPEPRMLVAAFDRARLTVDELRPATCADVEASHSSWAKRLNVPAARPATLLRARRR
jgi:16S rRNA (adenine(1408)-N(1))-methyltransferase